MSKVSVYLPGAGLTPLTPGRLDRVAHNAFTYGQCHALAIALAERLQCPLRVVVAAPAALAKASRPLALPSPLPSTVLDVELPDSVVARYWDHAVVEVGPDRYLDVRGIRSKKDLLHLNGYEPTNLLVLTSPRQLRALSKHRSGVTPNVSAARLFVDAVIDAYL